MFHFIYLMKWQYVITSVNSKIQGSSLDLAGSWQKAGLCFLLSWTLSISSQRMLWTTKNDKVEERESSENKKQRKKQRTWAGTCKRKGERMGLFDE